MERHERYLKTIIEHLDFACCVINNGSLVHANDTFRHSFSDDQDIAPHLQRPQNDVHGFVHMATGVYFSVKKISLDDEFTVFLFIERQGVSLVTDPLTGLLQRESFPQLSQQILDDTKARTGVFALLFVDLDGFKAVNDTWGHENGDLVLQKTAERMNHVVRNTDYCFRMGGDEFVIILSSINDRMHSCLVARRLISSISEPILLPTGNSAKVGASIGIATFPSDGLDVEDLLQKADQAMYLAKKLGKNNYQLHR
jgi:diguanylate cyclase (GGDEF)-like protein